MEEERYQALYVALRDPLLAYASQRLAAHEAADVVSDTFEIVWRKRRKAPAEQDALRAWCFGIARKKILQSRQKVHRKHHDARFYEDYAGSGIEPISLDDVASSVVEATVGAEVWKSLTLREREIASVVLTSTMSGTQTSAMLGISRTAYTTEVSRLRKKLEHLLSRDSEGEVL